MQKIINARAIYRHSSTFLLDEPSSNLDSTSEHLFFKRLFSNFQDHTILVITHKTNTIKYSDRVLIFDNGRLIENNTYQHLLQHGKFPNEIFPSNT